MSFLGGVARINRFQSLQFCCCVFEEVSAITFFEFIEEVISKEDIASFIVQAKYAKIGVYPGKNAPKLDLGSF